MVPPDGVAVNQTGPKGVAATCQVRALRPLLVIVTTCPVGSGRPTILLKFKLSGEALRMGDVGGAACTVNLANTVSELCPKIKESVA